MITRKKRVVLNGIEKDERGEKAKPSLKQNKTNKQTGTNENQPQADKVSKWLVEMELFVFLSV